MSSLDLLPAELCERIFQYACIDDGTTGRSLSLVSKYIRLTSTPYKFQSISVAGASQANLFVLILKNTPARHRRVSHLSISNDINVQPILTPRPNGEPSSKSPLARATTKAVEVIPGVRWYKKYKRLKQNVDHNVQCMQTNRRRDESIFSSFLQILHLTGNTLRELDMNFESRWKIIPAHFDIALSIVRIRSLPNLVSLRVGYSALFHSSVDESLFMDDDDVDESGERRPLLPSLRYLDLAGFKNLLDPLDLYWRIARFTPNLTHLRLPMRMVDGLWSSELERALGLSLGLDQESHQSHGISASTADTDASSDISTGAVLPTMSTAETLVDRLPRSLRRVYIQLSHPPDPACCMPFEPLEAQFESYTFAVQECKALEKRDRRVVVLDYGVGDGETFEDIAKRNEELGCLL